MSLENGASDGARTRDLRRDRPVGKAKHRTDVSTSQAAHTSTECQKVETRKSSRSRARTGDSVRGSAAGDAQLEFDFTLVERKRALVEEARHTFGVGAARRLWRQLGLPEVSRKPPRHDELKLGRFRQFLADCTNFNPTAEVPASLLFESYQQWALSTRMPSISRSMFGRLAGACGIPRRKCYSTVYLGIELTGSP